MHTLLTIQHVKPQTSRVCRESRDCPSTQQPLMSWISSPTCNVPIKTRQHTITSQLVNTLALIHCEYCGPTQAHSVLHHSLITLLINRWSRLSHTLMCWCSSFHIIDLVPVNEVLQSGNDTRYCKPASQLREDISKMNCEHDWFALCFNAARLLDY